MSAREKSLTEVGVAATISALAVLTAFHPNWVEMAFDIDLDSGSGSLEWTVVAVLITIALGCAISAYFRWNEARA